MSQPLNILCNGDGSASKPLRDVVLADFGLATSFMSSRATTSLAGGGGTPVYMAPEQWDDSFGKVGPKSDIWALGATMVHLLTGEPPYKGKTRDLIYDLVVRKRQPPLPPAAVALPQSLRSLLTDMLRIAPGERPESGAVVARIQTLLEVRGAWSIWSCTKLLRLKQYILYNYLR